MQTMNIPFTLTQANQTIALLDLAVKAGGLNVSATALEIAQIIQAAIQAEQQQPEPTK